MATLEPHHEPCPQASSSRRRPIILATVVVLLFAASAWLLWSPSRDQRRIPTEEDVALAAAIIGEGFREGDLLRIEPWWMTGPRRELLAAIGHPADIDNPLFPLDLRGHPDPLHLLRFERVWLVKAYSARATPGSRLLPIATKEIESHDISPRLRVSLHEIRERPLVYDLLLNLDQAVVHRGERFCPWQASRERHHCGEEAWKDVYPTLKEVGDSSRQCILAEPHPAGEPLRITYPEVPREGRLVLKSGFSIEGVRREAGADTEVRLLVDDVEVRSWIEPKNDFVWRETEVVWDSSPENEPAPSHSVVTIEIKAPAIGWRQLCLDGGVLKR